MRKACITLLILCFAILPACSRKDNQASITGPEGKDFPGVTVYLAETVLFDHMDEAQKLSDPFTPEGIYFLKRINEIVKGLGFHITFETIPNQWPHATPDPYGNAYTYLDTCMEYAEKLRQQDTVIVFCPRQYDLRSLRNYLTSGTPPLVRQVDPELWQSYAPQWYACNEAYIREDPCVIPTDYQLGEMIDNPVLLVQDEIAQEYEGEINTLDEYEAFLRWCKEKRPKLTPSFITNQIKYTQGEFFTQQSELINLLACELEGYPVDKSLLASVGFTLAASEERVAFLPVEQDPKFVECIKKLLVRRDEGLIDLYNLGYDVIPKQQQYASALVSAYYWSGWSGNLDLLQKFFGKTVLPFMEQTPYVLHGGMLPDLRTPVGYPMGASYIGANASDEAVEEWLSFLEYLHANRENLRSLLWGEEEVEYTMESGEYRPLPYPKPEELDDPYAYDFRYDFRALIYFVDERYPGVWTPILQWIAPIKAINAGKLQKKLDELVFPDAPQADILRTYTMEEMGALHTSKDAQHIIALDAVKRREAAFQRFNFEIFKIPLEDAELYIEEFARECDADCQALIAYYTELYKLGDWQSTLRQETDGTD